MTFSNSINWLRRDGPRWENLGITLSAGTFSITAADGTALSQSNAGYVTIPSKANPGQQIVYRIIANQTFVDDSGTSTIAGNSFGVTTTSGTYLADIPFFIYAVQNDAANAVSFMISRIPQRTTSPASANIGKTGSAVASTQGSFFALGNPTVTDYDANPCINIGCFRMQLTTNTPDWTVQTLATVDGIGLDFDNSAFTLALGSFGAAANTNFKANGGTAPIFNSGSASYTIFKSGYCWVIHGSLGATTAGVGAVTQLIALPFIQAFPGEANAGSGSADDSGTTQAWIQHTLISPSSNSGYAYFTDQAGSGLWLNSSTALNRRINQTYYYVITAA